jgi:serine protease Do
MWFFQQPFGRRSVQSIMKRFAVAAWTASLCLFPHILPASDTPATPTQTDPRRDATVAAIERSAPSVVNIATKTRGEIVHRRVLDWWRGVIDIPERLKDRRSAGSGVIVDEVGYVLTNVHVILDDDKVADEIWVQLWDDTPPIRARALVGIPGTDVAVLKLEAAPGQKFSPIKMAPDDDLLLGETVIALGNPLGLGSSVTRGILSAKPRRAVSTNDYLDVPDWLQIDAPINPGNSGGPLINLKGDMIGLNVAMSSQGQSIGFAIPVSQVSAAVSECFTPEAMNQLWLGLRFKPSNEREFTVSAVHPDSPADEAGIRPGDVLTRINGAEPKDRYDAYAMMAANDKKVDLTFLRSGKSSKVTVSYKSLADLIAAKTGLGVREIDPRLADQLSVPVGAGLFVASVEKDSSAAKVGIRPGMILGSLRIPRAGRQPLKTPNFLAAASALWNGRPGDTFLVTTYVRLRDWETQQFLLELK